MLLFAHDGEAFSAGAPLTACQDDMVPRHGFSAQTGAAPVEVVMDQARITPDTYLRVTMRSRRAFKAEFLTICFSGMEKLNKNKNCYVSMY